MEAESKRLNKYLSEAGFCSRRAADKLIEEGRVKVNGKLPELGTKVSTEDTITVDDKMVMKKAEKHVYIALHKPIGIVSTTDVEKEKNNIVDYIHYPRRIFPIGRLDKASEGLILLTSDGDIVNKILRAGNKHEKEYQVTVNKAISEKFIHKMSSGIPILGTRTKPCFVEKTGRYEFRIILTEGMNRQIRRMCEYLDFKVVKLKRVRIMHLKLDIPYGKWRELNKAEVKKMFNLVAESSKTPD